jgi:hypothetical protein
VRYDIYGQDFLIANKMESNGVEGNVHVSSKTKALLEGYCPGKFRFERYSDTPIKGHLEQKITGYLIKINPEINDVI